MSAPALARPPPPLPPAPSTAPCSDLERLHDDCRRGHKSGVEDAIAERPELAKQENQTGFTALHWASQTGHLDIVDLLLKAGADPNFQNHNGDTPLHLAVWKQHAAIVSRILEAKPNLALKNHEGKTAEQIARTEVIQDCFAKLTQSSITVMPPEVDDSDDPDDD